MTNKIIFAGHLKTIKCKKKVLRITPVSKTFTQSTSVSFCFILARIELELLPEILRKKFIIICFGSKFDGFTVH